MASSQVIEAIAVTAELCGRTFTPAAAAVFASDLDGFTDAQVIAALTRCRKEVRGFLNIADVVSRIDDGRPGGVWDAGHLLTRGSSPHLRFDRRNVHKQCKGCNRPGGTTRSAHRAGVEARIGLEALEALESDQDSRDYTKDDLRMIRDTNRKLAAQLKKQRSQ